MTEKEKQVLVEFIEQLQKKGFWTKTNNCEWAAVVKVTDIYELPLSTAWG